VLAAGLIGTVGIGWCFVANAASFAVVVVTLLSMQTGRIHSEGHAGRGPGQVRDAVQIVRSDPQLLAPLVMMLFVGTLTYEFEVTLPVFAERTLHAGAPEYSWLTACFGIGSIAAGVILLFHPQHGARRMSYIAAAYAVALAATSFASDSIVANALVVLVGACSIAFLVTGNSTIQLRAPVGMRGRVTSLWTAAFLGSTPAGGLLIGGAAQAWGGQAALLIGAGACVVASVVGWVITRR
jgi:predicted MFS family arabinose efflux permease